MPKALQCEQVAHQHELWIAGDLDQPPKLDDPTCDDCQVHQHHYGRMHQALEALRQPPLGVAAARSALAEALADARQALYFDTLDTPLGPLLLAASDRGLRSIDFLAHRASDIPRRGVHAPERLAPARTQLEEYFAGRRARFDLEVDLRGIGGFGERVLRATAQIPFGQVRSYGELAREIDAPGASRAVGNALGRNPIPIVIPCHRILRSDGSLGGYSGGPGIKDRLLALEGATF